MYKTANQHGFRKFSMLPVEIKEQIYEHALLMAGLFDTTLKAKPKCVSESLHLCYPRLPSICCLNKIEQSIATQILVRNTRIQLSHDTDAAVMAQWLTSIAKTEEKGFAAVYGVHPSSGEGVTRILEPTDICEKFDLGRLMTCTNLSHITFHVEGQGDASLYSLYETRCGKLEALAVMLKQDFMNIQNCKMEIEVQKLSALDFTMQEWEARIKDILENPTNCARTTQSRFSTP